MNKTVTIIIVILLFLGLVVQSAAVMDYYSENFDIGFFRAGNETETFYRSLDDNIRDSFFKPYEIQMRFDQRTIVVETGDTMYRGLRDSGYDVLKEVLDSELNESYELWDTVCNQGGVTLLFGGYFPVEYLRYIVGLDDTDVTLADIDKMMIVPGESTIKVYLHTDGPYDYVTEIQARGLFEKNIFDNVVGLFKKSSDYTSRIMSDFYRVYARDDAGSEIWRSYIEPDIPIVTDISPRYLNSIYVNSPEVFIEYINEVVKLNEEYGTKRMMDIADSIKSDLLTKSADLFTTHIDSFGNIVYTNQFNMYEVSGKGWVYYRYIPGLEGDVRGNIGDAFINAYETLKSMTGIIGSSKGEFYVSRVEVNENSYTFKYDYKYDSKVLAIADEPHAAVITATGTRTMEAKVLPLELSAVNEDLYVETPFILEFGTNLNLHSLSDLRLIEAYNIYVGYGPLTGNSNLLEPVMIFELKSGDKLVYSLKKGEE